MAFGRISTGIIRAHTFRLEPDVAQAKQLSRYAGINRYFWNRLLEEVNGLEAYPGLFWLSRQCRAYKLLPGLDFLKLPPSQALQQTAISLHNAFQAHFDYLKCLKTRKEGGNPAPVPKRGRPVFHKRGRNDSFRIPQGCLGRQDGRNSAGFVLDQGASRLYIPKLGWIRYRNSRDITRYRSWTGGQPKAAVVKRVCGRWFVTIFMRYPGTLHAPVDEPALSIGIDRGVKRAYQSSSGEYWNLPDAVKKTGEKIRRLQRQKDRRCQKGSRRWKDAVRALAKLHVRVHNIRHDFLHKFTTRLSRAQDFIAVEALEIRNMTRSAKGTQDAPGTHVKQKAGLNREILARGWGEFLRLLEYKMAECGGRVIRVDPRHTSQTCPVCRNMSPDNRKSQERFLCQACGHADNADHNAAVNILARGIRLFQTNQGRADGASRGCAPKRMKGERLTRPLMTAAGA